MSLHPCPSRACGSLLLLLLFAVCPSCVRSLTTAVPQQAPHDAGGESNSNSESYSALCVVARDENKYVREWALYHRCIGVGKIYLYDHNSSTPMSNELEDMIQDGFITYNANISGLEHKRYKEGFSSNLERFMTTIQGKVFKDCLERFGHLHRWVGFIDIDEFLVFHNLSIQHLNSFLKDYEAYGGLSLYWQLLGSSGHKQPPADSVVSSYKACVPQHSHANTQFKSFVNTAYRPTMYSPHRCKFQASDAFLVNELKERVASGRNKNSTHVHASVYHYATKSRADFLQKIRRGGGAGVTRPAGYVDRLDRRSTDVCTGAADTYERLCSFASAR